MEKLIQISESWREPYGNHGLKCTKAKYKCYCGTEFVAQVRRVKNLNTQSCGCLRKKRAIERNTKHGMGGTRLYRIWAAMKRRCYYEKDKSFDRYGGRGITVCDEWLDSSAAFIEWAMANGYEDYLTIDRIDNDGNYTPENCRWATRTQQSRNRSYAKMSMVKARIARKMYKELDVTYQIIADVLGVSNNTIRYIINNKTWKEK